MIDFTHVDASGKNQAVDDHANAMNQAKLMTTHKQ